MALPIYIQIHNEIKKNIEDGKWKLGSRIPSERQLSTEFNVSRMTLRQAIQTLVDEGILDEIATVPEKFIDGLSKDDVTDSFYASLKEKKNLVPKVSRQNVSATLASERMAEYLDIKKGDAILLLRQVTSLQNGQPFEYVRTQYVGERFEFYLDSKKSTFD